MIVTRIEQSPCIFGGKTNGLYDASNQIIAQVLGCLGGTSRHCGIRDHDRRQKRYSAAPLIDFAALVVILAAQVHPPRAFMTDLFHRFLPQWTVQTGIGARDLDHSILLRDQRIDILDAE
jgi:hypothetical protein